MTRRCRAGMPVTNLHATLVITGATAHRGRIALGRMRLARIWRHVAGGDLLAFALQAALNVLVVYWLAQLAFPSLGLHPPTILGAIGIAGLAAVLRRPIPLARWMRG